MKNNPTEQTVNDINLNVFFREFTFCKNDFKVDKDQLELADHVVWLDNIFFIFQIKDRLPSDADDDLKWFKKKVLDKAVSQIKNTMAYLRGYTDITIENNKGHKLDVTKAGLEQVKKIIIYTPGEDFPETERDRKFYKSASAGLIHLFHSEDYFWICKYLLTPAEIDEYLQFREDFYLAQSGLITHLPEQYILGHFLETLDVDHIDAGYVNNLNILDKETADFDMSGVINSFTDRLTLVNEQTDYYTIIKEVAKLKRSELIEFKKRFVKAIEACKRETFVLPYRIYVPRTDCGFVFMPLPKDKAAHWRTAITNCTLAHKYDQRAKKCLGIVVIDRVEEDDQSFNMYWMYAEAEWQYDQETEEQLALNFPFRKMSTCRIDNRYKDLN